MVRTASDAIRYLEVVLAVTDPDVRRMGVQEVIDYLKVIKLQEEEQEVELDKDLRRSYPVSTRGSGQPAED